MCLRKNQFIYNLPVWLTANSGLGVAGLRPSVIRSVRPKQLDVVNLACLFRGRSI